MFMQIPADKLLMVPLEKKEEMAAIDLSLVTEIKEKKDKSGRTVARLSYIPWLESKRLLEIHFPTYRVMYETFPYSRGLGDPHGYTVGWADYGNTGTAVYPYILDTETGKRTMSMFFPVMDYRHNAAIDPTVTDINTALQRAASKVVAIETWIGISVYRKDKEDLPPDDEMPAIARKKDAADFFTAPDSRPTQNGNEEYHQDVPIQDAAQNQSSASRFSSLKSRLK